MALVEDGALLGSRQLDMGDSGEDQMRRYKIYRQLVSLQRTPNGDFVIVSFEGETPGAMMAGLGESDNEFDKWFAAQIKEVHGIAPADAPPGPPSELVLEITA